MMKPTKILLALLRTALWNTPPLESLQEALDFAPLFELAKQQTVAGIVCGELVRRKFSLQPRDALMAFGFSQRIGQANALLQHELTNLVNVLQEKKQPFFVFKGQTLAALYPHPEERTPGDIDFYCPPQSFDAAVDALQNAWGVKLERPDEDHAIEFYHGKVLLEMHFDTLDFNTKADRLYWNQLLSDTPTDFIEVNGLKVPTLAPTLNVLYTFLHLYFHLIELGVGLRQFCDVAVLLHALRDKIDRTALQQHLKILNFTLAFEAIGWILIDKLGLPLEDFPLPISEKAKRYENDILRIVFRGGNFGMQAKHHAVRSGFRYYWETLRIKLHHYRLFYALSPRHIRATLLGGLPRRTLTLLGTKK